MVIRVLTLNTRFPVADYLSDDFICAGTVVKVEIGKKLYMGVALETPKDPYLGKKKYISKIFSLILNPYLLVFIKKCAFYNFSDGVYFLKMLLSPLGLLKRMPAGGPQIEYSYNLSNLNEEQDKIFQDLKTKKNNFSCNLLFGVTGCGKTEIYFHLMREVIEEGGQVLFLLPEISITEEMIRRIENSFLRAPVNWHSKSTKKRESWWNIYEGKEKIVLGARSALFLPFKNLKLIIIDEEHDKSYKQDTGVLYNCRDMAVLLASILKIPIILGSATPSSDSYYNCKIGKYCLYRLENRFSKSKLPKIITAPLLGEKEIFSSLFLEKAKENLNKGEQILVFLNRRGYVPVLICKSCHHKLECKNCSILLTYYKEKNLCVCHKCNDSFILKQCARCGAFNSLIGYGFGIERIKEELEMFFPSKRIEIFSSDHENPKEFLQEVRQKKIDIIIGTQIISKGHNFPFLNLILIFNGDQVGFDYRFGEILVQNLVQVSGRAGRGHEEGLVIVQTSNPNNQVIQWIREDKYEEFLLSELQYRIKWKLPPTRRLVLIKAESTNLLKLEKTLKNIRSEILKITPLVEGPFDAPIFKVNKKFRKILLVNLERNVNVNEQEELTKIFKMYDVKIDINPYDCS